MIFVLKQRKKDERKQRKIYIYIKVISINEWNQTNQFTRQERLLLIKCPVILKISLELSLLCSAVTVTEIASWFRLPYPSKTINMALLYIGMSTMNFALLVVHKLKFMMNFHEVLKQSVAAHGCSRVPFCSLCKQHKQLSSARVLLATQLFQDVLYTPFTF